MPDMPWWSPLEDIVSAYFSESLYIMHTLDIEVNMESFQAFPRGKIADTHKGYAWGFKI